MNSISTDAPQRSSRRIRVFSGLAALVCCFTASAQPKPGSIVTHPITTLPNTGPSLADSAGYLYTATSVLPDAPITPGAAQTKPGGGPCFIITPPGSAPAPCYSAYIAKNDPAGDLVFATYLGGASTSGTSAVAIDSSGNLYIGGTAGSPFPITANAAISTFQATAPAGPGQTPTASFAAKLSADGSKFLYVTYLPSCLASPTAIAVDPQGNAYIAGVTSSNNDPAIPHVCVVKLSADGSKVIFTKVLAGSSQDVPAAALAVDASGNAYVTGWTASTDFPTTAGALQSRLSGVRDAFLTKLDSNGAIVFSTYLGGSAKDSANALQVDAGGSVYLAGASASLDFPTTSGSLQPHPAVPAQSTSPGGFVAKVAPDGGSVVWATYLTDPVAITLGRAGDLYVFGEAAPGQIPVTPSAPLPCAPGYSNAAGGDYVVHLGNAGNLLDATWVNQGILGPAAFSLLDNGSVVLAAEYRVSQITFGGAGWSTPPCMTLSALNAATLDVTPIVPGGFLTFLGSGIGPAAGIAATIGTQGFPLSLGGVQVFFDGTAAPLLYAQSGQVNLQAPMELSGRSSTAVSLSFGGNTFGPFTVPVAPAYPGLFRLQPGLTAQALAENQDYSLNDPSNPAAPGSVVMLWGTGFPAFSPACATGGFNPDAAVSIPSTYNVIMTGGGAVQYAGSSPTLACGVTQINMQVPLTASPGPLLITPSVCTNGGNTCQSVPTGALIYVR